MKRLQLCLLLLGAGAGLAALPQDPPAVAPAAGAAQDPDHSELEEQMEIVEEGMRQLRRSIRDEAQDTQSLALLSEIEAAALACKDQRPRMVERVPEADRAAFVREYRLEMIQFVEGVLAIEKALLTGDRDAARAAHKAASDMEDTGHERFTDDE